MELNWKLNWTIEIHLSLLTSNLTPSFSSIFTSYVTSSKENHIIPKSFWKLVSDSKTLVFTCMNSSMP